MTWLLQDLRFGLRSILKDRSFFFTAVLALALGIGSVTVIFTIIDTVVLHPFPYIDANRLYEIEIHDRTTNAAPLRNSFSVPEFLDIQKENQVFDRSFGVWEESTLFGDPGSPESLDTDLLTGNAFQLLGVPALLGRGLQQSDSEAGAAPVFVLSYKVWAKRFVLDRSIVGKTFLLNNVPTTLVGIMPQHFAWWGGDIWRPAVLNRARPGNDRFVLYGYLKRSLDPKAAESSVAALLHHLAAVYPDRYPKKFSVTISTLGVQTIGSFRPMLYLLLAAVGLILLIACANVANLLLARATTRQKEFSIRRALGASRFRLVAQLLSESLVLALSGSLAGCFLAAGGLKGLMAILPIYTFPDEADVSLNGEVLLVTIGIAFLTALLFGLAPALAASRTQSSRAGGNRGNTSFGTSRLRNSFVISQVALSLMLLATAGLLMRTFFLERGVDLGMRTDHLLTSAIALPASSYPTSVAQSHFVRDLLPKLEREQGVVSAAVADELPPFGGNATDFDIAGSSHTSTWKGFVSSCSNHYFRTLGMRTIAGRPPTDAEEEQGRRVAVINQTLARKYFATAAALGQHIQLTTLRSPGKPLSDSSFEVIGIVSDLKNRGPRDPVLPAIYIAYTVSNFSYFRLHLHTAGTPDAAAVEMTKQVLLQDPNVIPQNTLSMDSVLEISSYAQPRFGLVILATFASVGLLLVIVGVYGVASYSVAQRQREIGIRMALGARPEDIRSLIVRNSLSGLLAGVAIGLLLALASANLLTHQIWGISSHDPVTFASVVAILVAVGLVASYLPSRRVARVDPSLCLRAE